MRQKVTFVFSHDLIAYYEVTQETLEYLDKLYDRGEHWTYIYEQLLGSGWGEGVQTAIPFENSKWGVEGVLRDYTGPKVLVAAIDQYDRRGREALLIPKELFDLIRKSMESSHNAPPLPSYDQWCGLGMLGVVQKPDLPYDGKFYGIVGYLALDGNDEPMLMEIFD